MMDVQKIILSRYYYFQVANIFITISAGSFSFYLVTIWEDPSSIPRYLAGAFPQVAHMRAFQSSTLTSICVVTAQVGAYFIEFLLIKTLFGLPWELSRAWPALQVGLARLFSDKRYWTERSLREAYMTCPEWLYGWVYPSVLSVIVIVFAYQVGGL